MRFATIAARFLQLFMLVIAASVGNIGMLICPVRRSGVVRRSRQCLQTGGLNCTAICTAKWSY